MADVMSRAQRSSLMSRIRGKNTKPELKLRQALWALGLRYQIHKRIGRFKPDLVFIGPRVAVFVDGCFWHCCPVHGVMPKGNGVFWRQKLEGNVQRDVLSTETVTAAGWRVVRFWEHEIETSVEDCARLVAEVVAVRTAKPKEDTAVVWAADGKTKVPVRSMSNEQMPTGQTCSVNGTDLAHLPAHGT